jgi:hypothetical protein
MRVVAQEVRDEGLTDEAAAAGDQKRCHASAFSVRPGTAQQYASLWNQSRTAAYSSLFDCWR